MAANTDPIYSRKGSIGLAGGVAIGTSIVSDYDGTGANNVTVFTADSTNGSYVQRLRFKALGTNAQAVARVYIFDSSGNTAADGSFYDEVNLPSVTGSTNSATASIDQTLNFALPAGYRIKVGVSSTAALATGWVVTVIAGDY